MTLKKFCRILVLLIWMTKNGSQGFVKFGNDIINYNATNTILEFVHTIESTASDEAITTTFLYKEISPEMHDLPLNCSQREKLKNQPLKDRNSRLRKCCPIGESLTIFDNDQNSQLCDSTNRSFQPDIINAILYDNCIEDDESNPTLNLEVGNPCNTSIVYNNREDIFFVLQDGSILIMDEFSNDTYSVQQKYCMDMDNVSGTMYAFICITSVDEHLKRGQVVTVAVLTLISIPCLCLVSYLHLAIKELRTLHGVCLSLMSLCLMLGYLLHSVVYIFDIYTSDIGYAAQFFMLSYFFWYFCLCGNVSLNIWLKVPQNKSRNKYCTIIGFTTYCLISFLGSLILVILTILKGLPGMPSYFLQGVTESIRGSQRYFIPPVSSLLFISFLIMIASFFGFQKIKKEKQNQPSNEKNVHAYFNINMEFDEERYEEVKKDAKCISLLGVIMIIAWLLEIITFYSAESRNYLVLLEIINGLQGVFIMLIFIVVRRRRTVILRWWYDRGSHTLDNVELSPMN